MGLFGIFFSLFTIPFFLVGIFLLTSPYWSSKTAKTTYYAITDKRAISVDNGKKGTVAAYNLSDLGAPYIVGAGGNTDLHWTLQPSAVNTAQSPLATTSASRGLTVTVNQRGTINPSTSNQAVRFEFTCLKDAQTAFNIANSQNQQIEEQRHKADPLGLDDLKTMFSQGKLYVISGMDIYEFDGTRVGNRKSMAKYAGFIVGPIVLFVAVLFGLNVATNIANARSFGFFSLIQPAIFCIFLFGIVTNVLKGGRVAQAASQIGGPPIDFSNSKVIERLQKIYTEQSGGKTPERSFLSKLGGYVLLTVLVGAFGTMMLVPIWSSVQDLQKALNHQTNAEPYAEDALPLPERIKHLTDLVNSSENKVAKSTASKKVLEENKVTLAYRCESLAAAQIEASLSAEAADSYAEALPLRYEQLQNATTQEVYDKALYAVALDSVWYADCLREVKDLKAISRIAPKLISEVEKTAQAKSYDPLTEKEYLINQMTKVVKTAGFEQPQKDTNAKLQQLQKSSLKRS